MRLIFVVLLVGIGSAYPLADPSDDPPTPPPPPPPCPTGWNYDDLLEKCLIYVDKPADWNTANEDCFSRTPQGSLLSIHNAFENQYLADSLRNKAPSVAHSWVGGHASYDDYWWPRWDWVDGTEWDYYKLKNSFTYGNHCAYLNTAEKAWEQTSCTVAGNGLELTYYCGSPPTPAEFTCLPPDQQLQYNCKMGWQQNLDTGFEYLVAFDKRQSEGEAYCVSQGAHLASIHSQAENDFILNLCCQSNFGNHFSTQGSSGFAMMLTGGHKDVNNGTLEWTDGTPFDWKGAFCYGQEDPYSGRLGLIGFAMDNYIACPYAGLWETHFDLKDNPVSYSICKRNIQSK